MMYFLWETKYVASWLCLKQKGDFATVVELSPSIDDLPSKYARIYDAYANGEKVYSARDHFKVGQKIRIE